MPRRTVTAATIKVSPGILLDPDTILRSPIKWARHHGAVGNTEGVAVELMSMGERRESVGKGDLR